MTGGYILIIPQSLYLELKNHVNASEFAKLVPATDGGQHLELTEEGVTSKAHEARILQGTVFALQGASIHVKTPQELIYRAEPVVRKPNFAAMRAQLLGKKGRW